VRQWRTCSSGTSTLCRNCTKRGTTLVWMTSSMGGDFSAGGQRGGCAKRAAGVSFGANDTSLSSRRSAVEGFPPAGRAQRRTD